MHFVYADLNIGKSSQLVKLFLKRVNQENTKVRNIGFFNLFAFIMFN